MTKTEKKPLRGEPLDRLVEFILNEKIKKGTEYTEFAEKWGVSRTMVYNLVRQPVEKRTKKLRLDDFKTFLLAYPAAEDFIYPAQQEKGKDEEIEKE